MARMKMQSAEARQRTAEKLKMMNKRLRLAERHASRGDCESAKRVLNYAYHATQYPATQRARDLAYAKFSRVGMKIARICRM